jgi:ATP-dependent DNA helicase RecG
MTPAELQAKLTEFLSLPAETEWLEFKEAKNGFDSDDLGKYFSALSNEANLKGQAFGWLIFGVKDKPIPRSIVGSQFRPRRPDLDSLKREIAVHTGQGLTFEEIYELDTTHGRVVMFQIPAALRGMPTSWKKHFYGRDHNSLVGLNLQEIERIRSQVAHQDWSAAICDGATLDDLDPAALRTARQRYRDKNPSLAAELDGWSAETLLNKAKLSVDGRITRTAIILLGRPESDHFLQGSHPQLSWILKDRDGLERDYKHYGPPFLLAVDAVLGQIRNLTCRVLPWGTLFPVELLQYDPWVLRETLHNAIAHQDYAISGRINVVEFEDRLVVANMGVFLPGDVESVIRRDAPFSVYRNSFLAQAMVNLQMIDTIGSGIKRIFQAQKKRSFPMPDYDLSDPNEVKVVISNKILNERYTQMLLARADLDLWDVIALDKVQKKKPLTDAEFKSVKGKKLVEGRRPNLFVSAEVAAATDTVEDYLNKRGIDKAYCKKMVVDLLERKEEAIREDIDGLLRNKLSNVLTEDQKSNFIRNLLQEMRHEGTIERIGPQAGPGARWVLSKPPEETEN